MTINVEASGGTFVLNYHFNEECVNQELSMVKSNPSDTWYSVTVSEGNKTITIAVTDNGTNPNVRSAFVTPHLESKGDCPNSVIYITQQGTKICTCQDLIVDLYAIPQSGISNNAIIGTYSIECKTNLLGGAVKYEGTTVNAVRFENGYIRLVGTIDANTSDSFKEFTFEILYDGDLCSTYNLSQEGTNVKCDCASIEYYIKKKYTKFNWDGTSGNEVMIASADTHGCGSLSAKTFTNTIFVNDSIRTEVSDNGHYYYWYATVKNVNIDSTSSINVYYKDRDESTFQVDCYTAITVSCLGSTPTCGNLVQKKDSAQMIYYDYDDCIFVKDYPIYSNMDADDRITFVPHLITEEEATDPQMQLYKRIFSSITTDYSGVEVVNNEVTIEGPQNIGSSSSGTVSNMLNPLISADASSPRKFFYAIDVYVNSKFCYTEQWLGVANQALGQISKCDVLSDYGAYKDSSLEYGSFDGWPRDGYDSSAYNLKSGMRIQTTPSVFVYNSNGSDISGQTNWQSFDMGKAFPSYRNMLLALGYNNCIINALSDAFNIDLTVKVKFTSPMQTSQHFVIETDNNGNVTSRVKLISGDTSASYVKEIIPLNYQFYDEEETLNCMNVDLYLRARKETSYVDRLDYTSCSTLMQHLTVTSDGINLDNTAEEAFRAGGLISHLSFNGIIPHEKVQLKNMDDGTLITLNLYWDDPSLGAYVVTRVGGGYYSYQLYPSVYYDTNIVWNAFQALNVCGACEEKEFDVTIPSSLVATSFTVSSLVCSINNMRVSDGESSFYHCSTIKKCSDINVEYSIQSSQTYSFPSIVGSAQEVGTFAGITDTQNYRMIASFDNGTPISSFNFDYTNRKITMLLNSGYHAVSTETTQTVSVLFITQVLDCNTNQWVQCETSDIISITLTDIPT